MPFAIYGWDSNRSPANLESTKAVIAEELASRGVPENEITSIGMGADKLLVSPDNTAAKKAKNRRYEIQVRL